MNDASSTETLDWPAALTADEHWCARQPGMNPWSDGQIVILGQLGEWIETYRVRMELDPLDPEDDMHPNCLHRLWTCWRHHWKQAVAAAPQGVADGREVARQIQRGEGFVGKRSLGGDPLRDVLLADAVCRRDERATELFISEFQPDLMRLAARIVPSLRHDESWWNDFVDHLAGYTRGPGKLTKFHGRCALRNFLPTVARNFLIGRLREPQPHSIEVPAAAVDGRAPSDHTEHVECHKLLVNCLREGLGALEDGDRLVLQLRHEQGLSGKEAAAMLHINPGTFSRRVEGAIERLHQLVMNSQSALRSEIEACIAALLGGSGVRTLADELVAALQAQNG